MIANILNQLNIDSTVFYQLAIFVILYFALRNIVFSKLQFVLERREDKTTKLSGEAASKTAESDRLKEEYQGKMLEAQKEVQSDIAKQKEIELGKFTAEIKTLESELEESFSHKCAELAGKTEEVKKDLSEQTSTLSKNLVEKILS